MGREATEKIPKNSKKTPKNSNFKPLCTIFVPCMKIPGEGGDKRRQWGAGGTRPL